MHRTDQSVTPATVAALAPARPLRLLAAALLAVGALALAGAAQAQGFGGPGSQSGISVTGNGVAFGEPDQAVVNLGVDAVGENVREALDAADATMHAVREAALLLGIEEVRTLPLAVLRRFTRRSS